MANLINPLFLDMDDESTESVNGCFTGSDYWQPEKDADKAIRIERELRAEAIWLRGTIASLEEMRTKAAERKHYRREEILKKDIQEMKERLDKIEIRLGWRKNVKKQ